MAALRGDALLARGASLLAASPDARLWAIVVCGPAPSHGTLKDVPALLAAGADPAALAWPEWDYVAIAAAAMRACADHDGGAENVLPLALNRYAALHAASLYADDGALVALLAPAASNVDVRGAYDNWTPLHAAIGAGLVGSVRELLAAGAHPLARRGGLNGSLPLDKALELPDRAASSAIAKLLRTAIAREPLPAPPLALAAPCALHDSAYHEFSSATRKPHALISTGGPAIGVPVAAMTGCGTCGKHALRGDDPHGIRGQDKMRGLSKCGACGRAFYCSRDCQRADWARHKPVCVAARADSRASVEIVINDLGREPSPEAIAAAVRVFHERMAQGLSGRDNPLPSFVDGSGTRKYC